MKLPFIPQQEPASKSYFTIGSIFERLLIWEIQVNTSVSSGRSGKAFYQSAGTRHIFRKRARRRGVTNHMDEYNPIEVGNAEQEQGCLTT